MTDQMVAESVEMRAIEDVEWYGFAVIEDAISAAAADDLAERCRELHRGDQLGEGTLLERSADGLYETLFGVQNAESLTWACAGHPQVLAVARHFLGEGLQLAECASKIVRPGGKRGKLHVDSAHDFPGRLPDVPYLINTMWMLTDFTEENGATLVVPGSHLLQQKAPPGWGDWDKAVAMTGRRGSVAIFRSGIWHAVGQNSTRDFNRVGLNAAYYPAWWNIRRESNHQPILPEVFADMPPALRELQTRRVGRRREEVYE